MMGQAGVVAGSQWRCLGWRLEWSGLSDYRRAPSKLTLGPATGANKSNELESLMLGPQDAQRHARWHHASHGSVVRPICKSAQNNPRIWPGNGKARGLDSNVTVGLSSTSHYGDNEMGYLRRNSLVLLVAIPSFLLGCGSDDPMVGGGEELTAPDAVERQLTIQSHVYVDENASSSTIKYAVERQVRTAFGPLRIAKISVDDRELKSNVDPSNFQTKELDLVKKDDRREITRSKERSSRSATPTVPGRW